MPTIYRKTTKGQSEIETRAHRLAPRSRSLLILIDGRRNDDELIKLMPQAGDAALAALAEGGFIEPISVTLTDPRPHPSLLAPRLPPSASSATYASPSAPAAPWPVPANAFAGREPPTLPLPTPAPSTARPNPPPAEQALAPWLLHRREEAARALVDLCGPLLAEPLAVRLEKARSSEELAQVLDLAIQLVANVRGRQKAVDFGTRFKGG